MSLDEVLSEDDVLNVLGSVRGSASVREIASGLSLRHAGRRTLSSVLSRLKRQRLVEELKGGQYRLAGDRSQRRDNAKPSARTGAPKVATRDSNLLSGRLVAHRDGYGFVVPDSPRKDLDGDLFIPPDQLGDAMHGDRVIARIERRETRGSQAHGSAARAEGRVERVLGRAHPTVVGIFHYGHRSNFVIPYESRIHHEIMIPVGEELTPELVAKHKAERLSLAKSPRLPELDGAVVNVEITRFPRAGVAAAGRVVEVLGRPGEFGIDVEIMIRKHHLPHQSPAEL